MIVDFETMKSFIYFFPHNNYDSILEKLKLILLVKNKTNTKKIKKAGRKPKKRGGTAFNKLINRRDFSNN